jgi:cardiolipin synthase (CMP-forming)
VTIPNLISLGRLVSVPVIVWVLLSGFIELGFWLFVAAAISDGIDGFIAKRFNRASVLGAYLDPIADKVLLVSIYISLGQLELLPLWLVILVVSRDILIVGAVILSFALEQRVKMAPLTVSKINTFAQIGLAAMVMSRDVHGLPLETAEIGLIMVVAVSTVLSGAAYVTAWGQSMGGVEGDDT